MAGVLGLGATSTDVMLDVNPGTLNTVRLRGNSGGLAYMQFVPAAADAEWGYISSTVGLMNINHTSVVRVLTGGTERMRIASSGGVSIGNLTDPGVGGISINGAIMERVFTITDGAAFEIDPGNGTIQLITLGASRTPKATNFAAGESITLMVDDGSAYTLTWTDATFGGSGVIWETDGGAAPTLSTSGYTTIVLWKVSTQVYGARVGNA